jgi:DNA mismatch endonuclease, patch repair protein
MREHRKSTTPAKEGPDVHRPRAPEQTSRLMERVRSSDTFAERLLRSHLHRMGLRYRKNVTTVFGRPDVAFCGLRVAVFVDGDYWHGRILKQSGLQALHESLKTSNRAFWVRKIQQNVARDTLVNGELERAGWSVVRIWETDVKRNPALVAARIFELVSSRRLATGGAFAQGTCTSSLQGDS